MNYIYLLLFSELVLFLLAFLLADRIFWLRPLCFAQCLF